MTYPIPAAALDDRLAWLGTAGSCKRDPRTGKKAAPRPCAQCGKAFAPCLKRSNARFCSGACVWMATKGRAYNAKVSRDSAVARGNSQRGRGNGKTYRKLNGRHEHRVVAEQALGRSLERGEVVHHADETKINNVPDNLEVLESQAEHARRHFTGKKQSAEHVAKRIAARMRTVAARRAAKP